MSQTTGNTAGLLPLKLIAPDRWKNIVDMYRDQNASEYLPSTYSPEQVSGYEAQRTILADSLEDEDNAVIEFPIQATGNILLLQTKEVSRGTAMLDPNDIYAEPVLDYGTFINPVDVFIGVESIRFARVFHTTKALQSLSPREQAPGTNITSDEDLLAVVRSTSTSSAAHISGTCSMMPRELAGVVGPDLLVYGLTGVSVVDSSIMPLIPGAHICATVYAVAEKAADIIKKRHKTA
ncbi:hypothetical protein VTK73DRAFT_3009 [Phialemonium thermophilum]|uniref:Glucose-methanol-choline oxidoreductase C-terminal domain-containing protein n=1 Tax=Phialemonium thermophilum TaxID=223376 RepID=A0ABR3X1N2_9PEZI